MSDFMSQIRQPVPTLLVTKPQDIYNELYVMLYLLELIHNTLRFKAKEEERSVVELRLRMAFSWSVTFLPMFSTVPKWDPLK